VKAKARLRYVLSLLRPINIHCASDDGPKVKSAGFVIAGNLCGVESGGSAARGRLQAAAAINN
jgi:hypothetical protein